MEPGSYDRRAAWTPPPRPDWVKRVNDECSALDIAATEWTHKAENAARAAV